MASQRPDSLGVYRHHDQVGRLWQDENGKFTFQYSEDWLARNDAIPLSIRHPLQHAPITNDETRPFFTNLLPEDEVRDTVVRNLHLGSNNDFELLGALGGDCAGDVSMFPADLVPTDEEHYRNMTPAELEDCVTHLHEHPLLAGEAGVRLALSGNQDKLPVFMHGERIAIPVDGAPSSHIIKPGDQSVPGKIVNEAYCTELARMLKLPVAKGTLRDDGTGFYIIERSDRRRTGDGRTTRVHQEDFYQLVNCPPGQSGENRPGLKQCFEVVRKYSANPARDMNALLKWVIYNYLIGNNQANAKNLALVYAQEGPALAPFCDLICTSIYEEAGRPLSLKIGGEDRPSWIIARRWETLARDINIKPKYVKLMLGEVATDIVHCADQLAAKYLQYKKSADVIAGILKVIKSRSRSALMNLRAEKKH